MYVVHAVVVGSVLCCLWRTMWRTMTVAAIVVVVVVICDSLTVLFPMRHEHYVGLLQWHLCNLPMTLGMVHTKLTDVETIERVSIEKKN